MTQEEFQAFIDSQDEVLIHAHEGNTATQRERVLTRTVKLGEEFGELCDAILASTGNQRKDKLVESSREELEGEFADVVIVVYLIAKTMGIDMNAALAAKVKKILEKHNTQL